MNKRSSQINRSGYLPVSNLDDGISPQRQASLRSSHGVGSHASFGVAEPVKIDVGNQLKLCPPTF